jgi:hypothetical protein
MLISGLNTSIKNLTVYTHDYYIAWKNRCTNPHCVDGVR